jgi:hypothetical protein
VELERIQKLAASAWYYPGSRPDGLGGDAAADISRLVDALRGGNAIEDAELERIQKLAASAWYYPGNRPDGVAGDAAADIGLLTAALGAR